VRSWLALSLLGSCAGRSEPPPPPTGSPEPGPVVVFEETFETTANVDPLAAAVVVDGVARGPIVPIPEPLAGTERLVVSGDGDLAPGRHVLRSVEVVGSATVAGDLALDLAGPLRVADGATLVVEGDLTVVVGGAVTVEGAVEVRGAIAIAQPTSAGLALVGGLVRSLATPGGLRIDTRGGLTLDRSTIETRGETSPELLVRAYGDLVLSEGSQVQAGSPSGDRGRVTLQTEGSLLADDACVIGGRGPGGTTVVRVGGDLGLTRGVSLQAGGRRLDVVVAGALEASGESRLWCQTDEEGPCDLLVTADTVVLEADSSLATEDSGFDRAGNVAVSTASDLRVATGSSVRAGDGRCADGGSIELRSGGRIEVATVQVGTARGPSDGEPDCPDGRTGASGSLVAAAAGAVELGVVQGGGSTTVIEGADLSIRVDPGLWPEVELRSVGLSVEVPDPTVVTAAAATLDERTAPIVVELSGNGTEDGFVPLDRAAGEALLPGWRYRATIPTRMFDSPGLDTIRVEYR